MESSALQPPEGPIGPNDPERTLTQESHLPSGSRRPVLRIVLPALAGLALLPALAWCSLALAFDGPAPRPLALALIVLLWTASGAMAFLLRPPGRALLGIAFMVALIAAWWITIPPRNDRDWRPEVAQLPRVHFDGSRVRIENVRNFDYTTRSDFVEHWETREYDLDTVRAFDIFLSYWGSDLIAHTVASWEFADGRHLAISIETRKEKTEEYSAVKGFFRQYELYYVVGDERDLIGLRTIHKGEQVYLYRIRRDAENARALLVEYLNEINRLAEKPRWYNAATQNCTTTIRQNNRQVAEIEPWDWRILANGRIDAFGYERGMIDTSLPFEELRTLSNITDEAQAAGKSPGFSRLIRQGLPGMNGRP